jgi:PhnB protein
MKQIHSYLTFNGNCREAMTFYQLCLGGELYFQTIGESPMADKMPTQMKDGILHSALRNDSFVIMASDMVGEKGLTKGTNMSLMLNFSNEDDIQDTYQKLATDGHPTHPLEHTFWGALFGGLTDKFGIQWLLNFDKTK